MDDYGSSSRHPLPRHRDPHPHPHPHPQPNSFTQHPSAQPPTVDGGAVQRQPDDPMAFLEFLSCSLWLVASGLASDHTLTPLISPLTLVHTSTPVVFPHPLTPV
ncbi:uncharacterized protein LOC62_04G005640 [Vanrija pseudolonga]|uniref:Uncharacterized protein n=1 Tax=Vanrija pseudolonga TaxID=143232 RepID=A0AAF1BRG0_9TREE|nr:hypothetical protein LOC62_04G005640 [Vanrija pseudolonga]